MPVNERRGRLGAAKSDRVLRILRRLPIEFDQQEKDERLLGPARAHRLSVYDAAYLALAARKNVPLATLDEALAAGRASGFAPRLGEPSTKGRSSARHRLTGCS
jgi:predicted nucleic acid-binding protein